MAYDHNSIHQQGSSSSGGGGSKNLEMMNSVSCWVEEEFFTTLNDSSKTCENKKTKRGSSSSSSSRHTPQQHCRSIQDISMDLHDILQEMQDEEHEEQQESRDDAHLSDDEIGSISLSNDSGMSMDSIGIAIGIGIGMRLNESSSSSSSSSLSPPHPTKESQLQSQEPLTAQEMSLDLHDILQELQEKGTRTHPEGPPNPPHGLSSTKREKNTTADSMDILNPRHPHNRSSLDLESVHWESFLLEHFPNNNNNSKNKEWQGSSKPTDNLSNAPLVLPNPISTNAKIVRFKTLETVHRY